MVIRRSGQRRRRVVIDEVANNRDEKNTDARPNSCPKPSTISSRKATEDSRIYSFGAGRRGQRKTTDFVPKRFLSLACVVLFLLTSVALLNLFAVYASTWQSFVGAEGTRMLALTGVGSLSSWFSSFLLIVTGLASLQIYALRQHRCDDYRGTYRVWLWLSLLFIVASVHCVVDFGSVLGNVAYAISNQPVGERVWVLVTFKVVALSLLVVRGLFEVKESRGAFAMVAIMWLAYLSAIVLQIPAAKSSLVIDYDTTYGNTVLFANTMLLMSHVVYARFVFLQANGLIKQRAIKAAETPQQVDDAKNDAAPNPKPKSVKTRVNKTKRASRVVTEDSESATPPAEEVVTQKRKIKRPPVPKPERKKSPPVPAPSKKVAAATAEPEPESESQSQLAITPDKYAKMSKSERRRQRKLEKRLRRAA